MNKKYDTWVIAFCPDTNEFFTSNQRGFFYTHDRLFQSEEDAIVYFNRYFTVFKKIYIEIMSKMCRPLSWVGFQTTTEYLSYEIKQGTGMVKKKNKYDKMIFLSKKVYDIVDYIRDEYV